MNNDDYEAPYDDNDACAINYSRTVCMTHGCGVRPGDQCGDADCPHCEGVITAKDPSAQHAPR